MLLICACAGGITASLFGGWWWFFDLFSGFQAQYLVGSTLAALGCLVLRQWVGAAIAGGCASIALWSIAPLWLNTGAVPQPDFTPLRVVTFNLNYGNSKYEDLSDYFESANADVIVALEATQPAIAALTPSLLGYESLTEPRFDAFGIALFARSSLTSKQILRLGSAAIPAIEVTFDHHGASYALLAVHTMPPISKRGAEIHDEVMTAAARWGVSHKKNAIIVGDFNATPWSHSFSRLIDDSQFVDSQRGFGLQTTWPAGNQVLSIPIDHCLHSPDLVATERTTGPFLGSDHRPLEITLAQRR